MPLLHLFVMHHWYECVKISKPCPKEKISWTHETMEWEGDAILSIYYSGLFVLVSMLELRFVNFWWQHQNILFWIKDYSSMQNSS